MIKIAVYPRYRDIGDQRVVVLDQTDLTIATHPAADVPLSRQRGEAHYGVFVSQAEHGLAVLQLTHSSQITVSGELLKPNEPVVVQKSDVVILGDHRVYVRETLGPIEDADLEQAMAPFVRDLRRTRAENPLRLVFADWLADSGQPDRAAYLRAQYAFANLGAEASEDRLSAAASRLRRLAASVDPAFRALTSVQPIENCKLALSVPCPRQWANLLRSDSEDVRSCNACHKNVYYCNSLEEARLHASSGDCVAIDPILVRYPRDLEIEPVEDNRVIMGQFEDFDPATLFDD